MSGSATVAPGPEAGSAGRAALTITILTAVSRATGLVRVLVVTAVLGDSFLGDTYQSANTVPNVLFELVAAGVLAAVLVPSLVTTLDHGGRAATERLAGQVLGVVLIGMAALAVLTAVGAPVIGAALTAGVNEPLVRNEIRWLAAWFLVLFAPQLVGYGVGAVATGVLHALHRFAAPAVAPAVNNVVVIATYLVFDRVRDDGYELELSGREVLVLGGGTTAAVAAFCAVPVIALARAGFRLHPQRPRVDNDVGRALRQRGTWAVVYVAASQVLIVAAVVLANGPGGQVVAYQFASTVFALPFALIATPVATALYPRMARAAHEGGDDGAEFGAIWQRGLRASIVLLAPAAAGLVALAAPAVRVALGGSIEHPEAVAHAVAAFAPGLVGFSAFFLLTRAWYADGDARTPALVNVAVGVGGVVAMSLSSEIVVAGDRAAGLAGAYSLAYTAGAIALAVGLHRRGRGRVAFTAVAPFLAGAVIAGVVMAAVAGVVPGDGRVGAGADVVVGGAVGIAVYTAVVRVLAGPLRPLVALDPPARMAA